MLSSYPAPASVLPDGRKESTEPAFSDKGPVRVPGMSDHSNCAGYLSPKEDIE
jgi:hypothetical protein